MNRCLCFAGIASMLILAACNKDYSRKGNVVTVNGIALQVEGEKIIRVSKGDISRESLVVLPQKGRVRFKVKSDN